MLGSQASEQTHKKINSQIKGSIMKAAINQPAG